MIEVAQPHIAGISDRITNLLIAALDHPAVTEIILFGSRSRGDYRNNSDIDLAVKGAIDFGTELKLLNQIDDLELIYSVDLVVYPKASEAMKASIDRGKTLARFESKIA